MCRVLPLCVALLTHNSDKELVVVCQQAADRLRTTSVFPRPAGRHPAQAVAHHITALYPLHKQQWGNRGIFFQALEESSDQSRALIPLEPTVEGGSQLPVTLNHQTTRGRGYHQWQALIQQQDKRPRLRAEDDLRRC